MGPSRDARATFYADEVRRCCVCNCGWRVVLCGCVLCLYVCLCFVCVCCVCSTVCVVFGVLSRLLCVIVACGWCGWVLCRCVFVWVKLRKLIYITGVP